MSTGHPLDPVLRPSSIAVVGASSDPRKRGHRALGALRAAGYAGAVYAVNPKGGVIDGLEVHRSVEALPEVPELALVCTPAETVPNVLEACGRRGVRGAVVLAVGFGESGAQGEALERCVLEVARRHGIRVVGPNTSGLLDLSVGLNLIGAPGVRAGSISLLVQSGNIALALMNEATARSEEGIAVCIGVGNELDLGFHDYLDYLGRHQATRVVVVYAEAFRDARAFLETAARVARVKPVLLTKGARSDRGREAARSHTGALAGEHDLLRVGLRQAGVVEVRRTDELFHLAETLATQPPVRDGAGVAILSDGGGQGALAADALSEMGVPLAEPCATTRERLRALLGRAAAVGNPVDLAGAADADPSAFGRALEVLASDDAVGGVLVVGLFGGYGVRFHADLTSGEARAAAVMAGTMRALGKPIVVHSMYAHRRTGPLKLLGRQRVPVVESLEVACRCIGEAWRRGVALSRPAWAPDGAAASDVRPDHDIVARARREGRRMLFEHESRTLLATAGVPFPHSVLCRSAEEAERAVVSMKTPAALKVASADIPHKSDAGGVVLDVGSAQRAREAYRRIESGATAFLEERGLPARIDGVLVTPMLNAPLAELLVGARRDRDVGPVLTLGAGGTWVELLADVSHRLLPVGESEVREMLGELRCYPLLTGARNRPKADLAAVARAAAAVARCLVENQALSEVEVNPLFVYARGVKAVDARVVLTSS